MLMIAYDISYMSVLKPKSFLLSLINIVISYFFNY